jgi:pimeloyl-ACP methyl ester carboxylesterase
MIARLSVFMLFVVGCTLGGTGKPPGAGDDQGTGVDNAKCKAVMAGAPMSAPGFDVHDSLQTATHNKWDAVTMPQAGDPTYPGGRYRTITPDGTGATHPGCATDGLMYTPATIPGFTCAAREFPFPAGTTEDTSKPIVILVHGNSDSPTGWIKFVHPDPSSLMFPADTMARDQLAEVLPAHGFRTIAIDQRTDKIDDPKSPEGKDIGNTPKNADHGWTVPLVQALIKSLAIAYPDRHFALVGFSLGATTVRDALRRLWVEWADHKWDVNILSRVDTVVIASGANHGVVSFAAQCGVNLTMRGTVTCQMGQRNQYTETDFHRPLNGPPMQTEHGEFGGWWETPCADGDYAYGTRGACGNHSVAYTTITMQDLPNGTQQDEFVSEHASRLYPTDCANNVLDGLNDFDTSGYFYNGYFRSHYGSVRSNAGLAHVLAALEGN